MLAAMLPSAAAYAEQAEFSTEDIDFFETKIRPVLAQHCYECHASDSKIIRGGLLVDSREALRAGGDSGPAVVPGDVAESLLIGALRHETYEMPPEKKLPDQVIADFEQWITMGAPDPRETGTAEAPKGIDWEAAADHWAFQKIADPAPPEVSGEAWVQSPLDRFILRGLEEAGMQPAAQADKRTLIRRATFDLIGLPPTVEEVNDFLADDSADAFAKVIDRLLESPHYGERWGRHWLDLVRYADTNGADENHQLPEAWRYRDWVVRKINDDLPLDQFITQQLAGDLLPTPEDEQAAGDLLTATGMLVIGPKMLAEQDKEKMIIDIVDEQVDTVSRTMLGLTIACARCHDHKFDPISAEDYYSLAGIFQSTKTMADRAFVSKWMERPLPSSEIEKQRAEHQPKIDAAQAELAEAEKNLKAAEEAKKSGEEMEGVDIEDLKKVVAAKKEAHEKLTKEMPNFVQVMAADEAEPANLPVHIRGNHLTPGKKEIPRGMPSILTDVAPPREIETSHSGRKQLADWLVAPENPLTSRVMANRLWMWHFGEALVRSPSNFGLQAEEPTHPELLDWLAQELMRQGWSLKEMHKVIMLSATYQMNSQGDASYAEADPENKRWWRQNRRRLEAEPVRDNVLAVGGELDRTIGGKAPNVGAKRRALYLPINRAALYEMFSTFDYVETANHIEKRPTTTVPHQALFLLNSPLVHEQAQRLAGEVVKQSSEPEARVDNLFQRLYARLPSDAERTRSLQFVEVATERLENPNPVDPWAALTRALMAANEFIYID